MQAMSNNGGGAAPQKQTQVEDLSQYISIKLKPTTHFDKNNNLLKIRKQEKH